MIGKLQAETTSKLHANRRVGVLRFKHNKQRKGLMRIDEEAKIVYVRQSWLKDMLLCPERSRLSVIQPEFKTTNDSAAIGTAVHAGIEAVLNDSCSLADAHEVSLARFSEMEAEGVRHTNVEPSTWHRHVVGLTNAWVKDIYPYVPLGGQSEVKFVAPTGSSVNGYQLWFEGTMDYVTEQGIWDWKTSARKYSSLEKQTQDVQSSIYTYAGQTLGFIKGDKNLFNFGVMVRTSEPYGQILSVSRTKAHGEFVIKQAMSAVAYGFAMTDGTGIPTNNRWLINDQHYLCSERWCPWWSVCKGASISEPDNQLEVE